MKTNAASSLSWNHIVFSYSLNMASGGVGVSYLITPMTEFLAVSQSVGVSLKVRL